MDRKFRSDDQWYISPIVNLRSFLDLARQQEQEFRSLMGQDGYEESQVIDVEGEEEEESETHQSFASLFGCSRKTERNVFRDLDLEGLISHPRCESFDDMNIDMVLNPNKLVTHKYALERRELFKNHQKKNDYFKGLKYYRFDRCGADISQWSRRSIDPVDLILHVHVVVPYNRILQDKELRSGKLLAAQSKFICRGNTPLLRLRNRIHCVSDLGTVITPGRELERPDVNNLNLSRFPSSFIFINDTFYNDHTMENSQDISVEIREFMQRKSIFDPTVSKSMEGVDIIDLTLRLGQPYVFQHSGNCEHLLIFSDLRLMTKNDEQDEDKYPIRVYEKGGDTKCYACKKLDATMAVLDCPKLPMSPGFLCEDCFKNFQQFMGVQIGEYQAFHYYQMNKTFWS